MYLRIFTHLSYVSTLLFRSGEIRLKLLLPFLLACFSSPPRLLYPSLSHTSFNFSQMLHTLIQYALLEILRCWSFSFPVAPSSSWGFSHAPKSLQHFCVCTTFARLEYFFYLTRIYCEKLRRVPSYFAPPLVPFTI